MYITRIAPSPTGDMHIGTARTAYFCWLAARASGGQFILRIDDTDLARNNPEHVKVVVDTFEWLGLDYDKFVYQSYRFNRYTTAARDLVRSGKAIVLDNGAIALSDYSKVPQVWNDTIGGQIAVTQQDIDNMNNLILIKGDGSPTYNWSCVIDDIDFNINYVIRGVDHISNTSKQILLYNTLGASLPLFAHVGLIHYKKKKLSKRDGAASMLYYRDSGYDPDAVLNLMIRLGWGPTIDDKSMKLIDKEKALSLFLDGGKMRSATSNLDLNMLESYDRKYKAKKGVWRTGEKLIDG